MIEKAISALVALVAAAALVWWFEDNIADYYERPLIEKHEKAIAEQKAASAKAASGLVEKKVVIKTVYVDRVKEIKIYEETLQPSLGCLADEPFAKLYNNTGKR